MQKINNKIKCPKCNSVNTVRPIKSYYNNSVSATNKSYFCCDCLIEFTKECIKIYSSNGIWMANIEINA